MKNGEGFLLVYSIVNQASFNELLDIREHVTRVKDSQDVSVFFLIIISSKHFSCQSFFFHLSFDIT